MILKLIGGLAILACTFLVFGCAVGRTQSGGVVVGPELGQLVETTNEALNNIGDAILPGLGVLLTAVGVPAIGWARAKARADASEAASDAHDDAWDEVTGKPPASNPLGVPSGSRSSVSSTTVSSQPPKV